MISSRAVSIMHREPPTWECFLGFPLPHSRILKEGRLESVRGFSGFSPWAAGRKARGASWQRGQQSKAAQFLVARKQRREQRQRGRARGQPQTPRAHLHGPLTHASRPVPPHHMRPPKPIGLTPHPVTECPLRL